MLCWGDTFFIYLSVQVPMALPSLSIFSTGACVQIKREWTGVQFRYVQAGSLFIIFIRAAAENIEMLCHRDHRPLYLCCALWPSAQKLWQRDSICYGFPCYCFVQTYLPQYTLLSFRCFSFLPLDSYLVLLEILCNFHAIKKSLHDLQCRLNYSSAWLVPNNTSSNC